MSNPVYMVGIIDVKDFETYAEQYGMPVGAMFAEVGAEIVAASTEADNERNRPLWSRNPFLAPCVLIARCRLRRIRRTRCGFIGRLCHA